MERALTLSFMTLALAQLFHLGNARSREQVLSLGRMIANPWAVAAVPLVVALQVASVHWPPLSRVLSTAPLSGTDWAAVLGLSLVPAVVGQSSRLLRRGGSPID
jgi:Ca2+-transporting ATPase